MDDRDTSRILLSLDQYRKKINREKINPGVEPLDLDRLQPVITMVADMRATYIKKLFELAEGEEALPSAEQIDELARLRKGYSELVDATNAMEVAIERGYLDLKSA